MYRDFAEFVPVAAVAGGEGGHAPPAALSRGWHFKENKKFGLCAFI